MDTSSLTWQVTPDLLGVLDANGKFMKTNPAWLKTLGRTAEEIESRLFFDFIHPDDLAITAKAFVDVQKGKPILGFENRYCHADGSYRWLSWNAVPEGDLFICSARDVTEAKQNEFQLHEIEREAELREQFISILGHDLRNPLAGAACAIQFLQMQHEDDALSDRAKTVLHTADTSLQRMAKLIDDVLDFARARMGGDLGIKLKAETNLRAVLFQTVEEMRIAHQEVKWVEDYDFDDPVTCDPARIAQLVSNLLGNAATHGVPGGTIHIQARDVGSTLKISVANRGGTIPAQIRARLFEPFSRTRDDDAPDGLGLGLYIAKQIATGHGGDIDVMSRNGETTFTVTLPRGRERLSLVSGLTVVGELKASA